MVNEYKRNLSIIIPHYNTPDLLQKLLDSIPHIKDIQIIVVDDNSTVRTDELAAIQVKYGNHVEFYKNDTSIKGAGTCRNIGMRHADGKWLLFADADDFFMKDMYEKVSTYFNTDYDEIFFTPTSIYIDTGEPSNRHCALEERINNYLSNPTRENMLKLTVGTGTPWSKLIRHEMITAHDIWFDEVLYSNDHMFSVKAGHYSQNILASEEVIYCITRNKGSLTTHVSWEAFEIRLHEYIKVCDFIMARYSRKEVKAMRYTCFVKLMGAVKQHYGISKYIFIIRLFYKHNIPLFTWGQPAKVLKNFMLNLKSRHLESQYYIRNK